MKVPTILYKYRSYSSRSLEMLIRKEIYFASSSQLNDPYDCQINVDRALEAAITAAENELHNKTQTDFLQAIRSKLRALHKKINEDLENAGIFSLSKEPDNVLMWSHYASNHSGFVIGFQLSEETRDYQSKNLNKIIGTVPVDYTDGNPFTKFFLDLTKNSAPIKDFEEYWPTLLSMGLTSKTKSWEYEREYRVIRKTAGAIPFKPDEIVEIIFGLSMGKKERETIRQILSGEEWSHIKFKSMKRSADLTVRIEEAG